MTSIEKPLSRMDLDEILRHGEPSFRVLQGQRILITGGTGFFGKWLTQGLLEADRQLSLGLSLTLLSRDPQRAMSEMPWIQDNRVRMIRGDVGNFSVENQNFDSVIHGAVSASAQLNSEDPDTMLKTNVQGTLHLLEVAEKTGAKRVLLTSSGAVYGRQPPSISHMPEDDRGGPDPLAPGSAYAEGKRVAELLGALWAKRTGNAFLVARCFAFVGPYLPLRTHFAAGNFMANILDGKPIIIQGDGTPRRSLMYGTDMVVWLLRILTHGQSCRAYNVGSAHSISIREMAEIVNRTAPSFRPDRESMERPVHVLKDKDPTRPIESYVPSVTRAHEELGLGNTVSTDEAFRRTLAFLLPQI